MSDFHPVYPDIVGLDPYKRVRYTEGMVLGMDEFLQEELYLLEKHRLHNRNLHGYGTVCGLKVSAEPKGGDTEIKVSPGIAIDPQGHEIRVPEAQCASINTWLNNNKEDVLEKLGSPVVSPSLIPVYLTLCYRECETDNAPIPAGPCLSLDQTQAPTRIADDYELNLSLDLPQQVEENKIRALLDMLGKIEIKDAGGGLTEENIGCLVRSLLKDESPLVCDPPLGAMHMRPSEAEALIRLALRIWVTEVRPVLLDSERNCVNGPSDELCVLLARIDMDVDETPLGLRVQNATVVVEQDERPFLLHSRLLQEWFISRANAQVAKTYSSPGLIFQPTRIIALSWQHGMSWDLRISVDGVEKDGVIVAFGNGNGDPSMVDVSNGSLAENTFQVFRERFYSHTLTAIEIVPLRNLIYADGFVVGGDAVEGNSLAEAAAFILESTWANSIRASGDKVRVVVRGDFVRDENGEAIDAHFILASLPTGVSPDDSSVGLRGGTFESWFLGIESEGGEILNINTATEAELITLPGINVTLARRIIEERARIRVFTSVDELVAVSGISRRMLNGLRERIRV